MKPGSQKRYATYPCPINRISHFGHEPQEDDRNIASLMRKYLFAQYTADFYGIVRTRYSDTVGARMLMQVTCALALLDTELTIQEQAGCR